jgi:hypothetical protein
VEEPGDFIYAFAIGMLVGVGELVGRYRDEPARALRSSPAYLYATINGFASVAALVLAHTFHWTFGAEEGTLEGRLMQILVAGFGAMAVFRSSLFIYRHQGEDIGIGPVAFLEVMLDATDRAVDRRRAQARDKAMADIMRDLSLNDVVVALPTLASNVMQNFSVEDQIRLGTQVKSLRDQENLDERIKVIEIGLVVMNVVGEEVLRSIVNTIRRERDHLKPPPESPGGLATILNALRLKPAPGASAGSATMGAPPPAAEPPVSRPNLGEPVAATASDPESTAPTAETATDQGRGESSSVAEPARESPDNSLLGSDAAPARRRRRRTERN